LVEPLFEALVSPHESSNARGDAENISSSLWHKARSADVRRRFNGSGSSVGRGGGWYWTCGAAQAVNASAHTALSSFEGCNMFFLLQECGVVPRAELGAQVGLGLAVDGGLGIASLNAFADGGGIPGVVPRGAVVAHYQRAAERNQH
jgi:hypothetical protein